MNRDRMGGIRLMMIFALGTGTGVAWSQVVGSMSSARNTSLAAGGPAQAYLPTKIGAKVRNGDGLRTGRRGYAEIAFTDKSLVRVNERTDLVVRDSARMRNLALQQGAVWVRVAKGVPTQVQTPVGTATARGTIFEVEADGTLRVLEGVVDLEGLGGQIETVLAGEVAKIGLDGIPVKLISIAGQNLTSDELARMAEMPGWWSTGQPATLVSPGGFAGRLGEIFAAAGLGFPLMTSVGGVAPPPVRTLSDGVSVVPEPATMLALGAGLAILAVRRKRR